jgi:predicted small metal-binding protein
MRKVIQCPCGYVVRAKNEEELVKQAQEHAKEAHRMTLTREQALAMARPE